MADHPMDELLEETQAAIVELRQAVALHRVQAAQAASAADHVAYTIEQVSDDGGS